MRETRCSRRAAVDIIPANLRASPGRGGGVGNSRDVPGEEATLANERETGPRGKNAIRHPHPSYLPRRRRPWKDGGTDGAGR